MKLDLQYKLLKPNLFKIEHLADTNPPIYYQMLQIKTKTSNYQLNSHKYVLMPRPKSTVARNI